MAVNNSAQLANSCQLSTQKLTSSNSSYTSDSGSNVI